MFALISHLLGKFVSSNDAPSHNAYLASSADLASLERRMRQADEADHAYSMAFYGVLSRDQIAFASNH